jgi:hypothetical protein
MSNSKEDKAKEKESEDALFIKESKQKEKAKEGLILSELN